MEGELCVDLDLEWNTTFDTYLYNFPLERNFMTALNTAAQQHTNSSPATLDSFSDTPAVFPIIQRPT